MLAGHARLRVFSGVAFPGLDLIASSASGYFLLHKAFFLIFCPLSSNGFPRCFRACLKPLGNFPNRKTLGVQRECASRDRHFLTAFVHWQQPPSTYSRKSRRRCFAYLSRIVDKRLRRMSSCAARVTKHNGHHKPSSRGQDARAGARDDERGPSAKRRIETARDDFCKSRGDGKT